MEKYRLVREHKTEESEDFLATVGDVPEARITQQGKPRAYISFGMNLFVSRVVVVFCSVEERCEDVAFTN